MNISNHYIYYEFIHCYVILNLVICILVSPDLRYVGPGRSLRSCSPIRSAWPGSTSMRALTKWLVRRPWRSSVKTSVWNQRMWVTHFHSAYSWPGPGFIKQLVFLLYFWREYTVFCSHPLNFLFFFKHMHFLSFLQIIMLVIAWHLEAANMGFFTKDEWLRGMTLLQ